MRGIGVAVITEHVRLVAHPLQHRALLDAEAVLLVDDHEPEPGERRVAVEQRVGADDDVDLARRRARPRSAGARPRASGSSAASTPTGRSSSSEPSLGTVSPPRYSRATAYSCSASTSVGAMSAPWYPPCTAIEQRGDRDDGLARPDLALQQPVHRHRAREVAADHVERALLVARSARTGSAPRNRSTSSPSTWCSIPPRSASIARLRSDERELDAEELVEAQPPLRLA